MIATLGLLALQFLLLSNGASTAPRAIEGKTGPPRPAVDFVPMRLQSRKEYEDDLRWRGAPAHRWPDGLSDSARYGSVFLHGDRRTVVIDKDAAGAYTLRVDFDGDADLSKAAVLPLKPEGTSLAASFKYGKPPSPMKLVVELDANGTPGDVELHSRTEREGVITVAGQRMPFVLLGTNGRYDGEEDRVFLDVDFDGKLDTSQRSTESVAARDGYVNLGEVSYGIHVDPRGDRLTLEPLGEKRPGWSSLEPGTLAPEFAFRDAYGVDHNLVDYRGKFVLLYFWGTWCTPCVADTPKMREIYETYKDRGFEIVAVDRSDDVADIRSYIVLNGLHWPQTPQGEDGPILALYRVNQYPTTFLLDKEGKILARGLRGDELAARLAQLLPEPAASAKSP